MITVNEKKMLDINKEIVEEKDDMNISQRISYYTQKQKLDQLEKNRPGQIQGQETQQRQKDDVANLTQDVRELLNVKNKPIEEVQQNSQFFTAILTKKDSFDVFGKKKGELFVEKKDLKFADATWADIQNTTLGRAIQEKISSFYKEKQRNAKISKKL